MLRSKPVKVLYFLLLVAMLITMFCLHRAEEFASIPAIDGSGNYLVHNTPLIPRKVPSVWAAEDGKLFVFYEEAELLNVYSVNGEFLYGLQFPDAQNGKSRLLFQDGLLYVDARGPGLYIFQDTELLRFEAGNIHNDDYLELRHIFIDEHDHMDGQYIYSYSEKDNNFSRTGAEGTEIVLQLPQKKLPDFFGALIGLMLLIREFIWGKPDKSATISNGDRLTDGE